MWLDLVYSTTTTYSNAAMTSRFIRSNVKAADPSSRQCTPEIQTAVMQSIVQSVLSTPHSKGTFGATEDEINGT
jgi:hypothetical protein